MLTHKTRIQVAVGAAIAGGTLAALSLGAMADIGPIPTCTPLPTCLITGNPTPSATGYGYASASPSATATGYGYGPQPTTSATPKPTATGYGYSGSTPTPAATATPTATASPAPKGPISFTLGTKTIAAGQHTKIIVTGPAGDVVTFNVKGAASRTYTRIATQTINSAGQTSLIISPSTTSLYRVGDSRGALPVQSLLVKAVQSLTLSRGKNHVMTFRGHVAPSLVGRRVTVYFYAKGGHTAAACTAKTTKGGQFVCRHTFKPGTYSFFAQTDADKYNAAGRSTLHRASI